MWVCARVEVRGRGRRDSTRDRSGVRDRVHGRGKDSGRDGTSTEGQRTTAETDVVGPRDRSRRLLIRQRLKFVRVEKRESGDVGSRECVSEGP